MKYLVNSIFFPACKIALLFFFTSCIKEEITESADSTGFYSPVTVPVLITTGVSSITMNSAISGGSITSEGGALISARGVCWSTTANPTIASSITNDGNSIGAFISSITGLSANTSYYVRAYATNIAGTAYGEQISFTTFSSLSPGEVYNPVTGKIWLDRNLGASRVATSSTDSQGYGDLYQWGRAADGHQVRTSGTTPYLSLSNSPGHGFFILPANSPHDWRSPQNSNLWQAVNGANNPCPSGYRLPTEAEWLAEIESWNTYNATGAFGSVLKLPVAGYRDHSNGSLVNVGSFGYYWSSTPDGVNSRFIGFGSSDAGKGSDERGYGNSVRCIKE